jgi:S-adenosylmethionine:diacylglycerol 3-amino-3-carboxypropyl transferase
MSDIASYMSQDHFEKLLLGIHHAAKHNARFCLRKLMSAHFIPSTLTTHFQRDYMLENKLEHEETHFVYRFFVGKIKK